MSDIVTWNIDPGEYLAALTQQRIDAIEADIVRLVESLLNEVEAWMKANHRWQNRTGNAEAGLYADIEYAVRQSVYLLMSHDVTLDYTWILEANPRTALLGDVSDHFWPILLRGAREIVRRHSG